MFGRRKLLMNLSQHILRIKFISIESKMGTVRPSQHRTDRTDYNNTVRDHNSTEDRTNAPFSPVRMYAWTTWRKRVAHYQRCPKEIQLNAALHTRRNIVVFVAAKRKTTNLLFTRTHVMIAVEIRESLNSVY